MAQPVGQRTGFGRWVEVFEANADVHLRVDAVFVRLRRLLGLRTELMVLTVAEVVALSYYGGLATAGPDPVTRAVAARIVDDENAHVQFQRDRLSAGFADSPALARLLGLSLWWVVATGATVVVALDHRGLLDAIGYPRTRFIRDVFADFGSLSTAVMFARKSMSWK